MWIWVDTAAGRELVNMANVWRVAGGAGSFTGLYAAVGKADNQTVVWVKQTAQDIERLLQEAQVSQWAQQAEIAAKVGRLMG